MDSEIKAEWIKRLTDGRPQVRSGLHTPKGQCCLGVLCEIAAERGVVEAKNNSSLAMSHIFYDGEAAYLPAKVSAWAGLKGLGRGVNIDYEDDLASLNDNGYSFEQIADVIKERL